MSDGLKMILGIFLVLGIAFVLVSIFFPHIIVSMNMTPIKFRWDTL